MFNSAAVEVTAVPPSDKAPVTANVPETVVSPVTSNVPATAVLPVALATVNLFVLISKLPSIPVAPSMLI